VNPTAPTEPVRISSPKYTITLPSRYGWCTSMLNDVQTASVMGQGESLAAESELICSLLRRGDVVLDVGANIGSLALAFASVVGNKGHVFAFEPQMLPYQCLVANVVQNSLSHIISPYQIAIGKQAGQIEVPILDPLDPNFGGCSLIDKYEGQTATCPLITVDIFDPPACHLLKVDVEGMEPDVLHGAYKTISKFRPALWVEHLDYIPWRENTKNALLAFFDEHDYNFWKLQTPTFSQRNIRRQTESPFPPGTGDQNVLALPKEIGPPDFSQFECLQVEMK